MKAPMPLYPSLHVPIPFQPPDIAPDDQIGDACRKLDRFFDSISRGYPKGTRNFINTMYHENHGIFPLRLESQGAYGAWNLYEDKSAPSGVHVVFIEQGLYDLPLVSRFIKMHEVAVHAGQAHQRISEVGIRRFLRENKDGDFYTFTEQSAALQENVLLNALPPNLIAMDLASVAASPEKMTAVHFMKDFLRYKDLGYAEYSRLMHRLHDRDEAAMHGDASYNAFHARADVKKFDAYMLGDHASPADEPSTAPVPIESPSKK
jgi:hypothetical protein